jgi:hypothetical protein
MANVVKHSHIPVFLKNTNEVRNTVNVSNLGMPSPFPVIIFEMILSPVDYNAVHVPKTDKPSHIPVLLQNIQN